MHPSRRRKKRPNYGIRTVEVMRGPNGFGFTISGQQPCILSCIVGNSPADQAGLRAGDFLISVNGLSVSKSTHDNVVNLIGNSIGPIKMTIAENYYSDSSDEDVDVGRMISSRKPRYTHRPRMHRTYRHEASSNATTSSSPLKKQMKLREAAVKHLQLDGNNDVKATSIVFNEIRCGSNVYNGTRSHIFNETNDNVAGNVLNLSMSNPLPMEDEAGPSEYKSLVGYLGTIEMPKQLLPNSRLQTVCSCIRKLRQEKRTPTAVLMTILPTCLTLKNASNQILAIYPTNRVVYIGSTTDKESRYFGLVTSAVCDNRSDENLQKYEDSPYYNIWHQEKLERSNEIKDTIEISNSCHVFVTDPKLVEHSTHAKKAEHFRITCTVDVVTGNCLEFPRNSLYIVSLVQNMYKLQDCDPKTRRSHDDCHLAPVMANSPQPSASSNSDSGIGFRDDCGNISDRILVVEFPAQRPLPIIPANNKRPMGIDASKIILEDLDWPLKNNHALNNVDYKNKIKQSNNNANENIHFESEGHYHHNLNNIRACENLSVKTSPEKKNNFISKNEYVPKHNNIEPTCQADSNNEVVSRLTVRAMPDPRVLTVVQSASPVSNMSSEENYRNADVDTGQIFSERPVDVPTEPSPNKKSFENISMHSLNDEISDCKSSVDNISVHSSKSIELSNLKSVFKTPSTKFFINKKSKRQVKVGSYDNLITDNYETSVLNYKLSPKVYGVSKPNCSYEELSNLESVDKCGYGSLQELCTWNGSNGTKRCIAQSEPDVRLERRQDLDCEENGIHKNHIISGGTAAWAQSFEKLLDDPLGLQTFAEFLKKEFSAENIYFWTACERFRRLQSVPERINEAQKIYQRHLCIGAPEPVNVDSHGRQCTEQSLQEADNKLFEQAQKQIFNLMKFDSYPRFIKSDLYKQCVSGNIERLPLDNGLLLQPPSMTPSKLKKSLSNAEDRRRKSLLPWHRKNRSKSKDRGETEYNNRKDDINENVQTADVNDVHSSKSSLTSQESGKGIQDDLTNSLTGRGPLCRVILSSGNTTIVQIRRSETIEQMVNRLLDKRGLHYTSFEVFTDKQQKPIDIKESSMLLAGNEVRVEQRVVFKLDLPNRKVIAVKSKYTKILKDVLKPILNKYDFSLDQVKITIGLTNDLDISLPVTYVDGLRLNVQFCEVKRESAASPSKVHNVKILNPTLEEITNKVFKEIIKEKADNTKPKSDRGSVKSEDWGSEHSSGMLGRFLRRDSGIHDRKKKGIVPRSKGNSTHSSVEDVNGEHNNNVRKPLIAKWKAGVKLQVACSESDELYEGLKRAQRSRLEDQRGTEINFELPDFLKDKENAQQNSKLRKLRRTGEGLVSESSRFTENSLELKSETGNKTFSNYENREINNSNLLSNNISYSVTNHNSKLSSLHVYSPNMHQSDDMKLSNMLENASSKNNDPPPLPPKPKILPIKPSNWGQNGLFKATRDITSKNDRIKPTGLYLEQSSFV